MARRKKNYKMFHLYENPTPEDLCYIRITKRMIMDDKFISLSNSSKVLYIYMRMWGYPKPEVDYAISLSKPYMSKNTFLKSIIELEKKGFIDIVFSNKFSHRPNRYKFSDRWWKEK